MVAVSRMPSAACTPVQRQLFDAAIELHKRSSDAELSQKQATDIQTVTAAKIHETLQGRAMACTHNAY